MKLAERVEQADLTPAMKEALLRLHGRKVWADGRSCAALQRRGLVELLGNISDEMLGDFRCYALTTRGLEVAASLRAKEE